MALMLDAVFVGPARHGRGLFAARPFAADETIIKIAGRVVDYRVLWERGGRFAANCLRFGPETYLDPGDSLGRYVNHSCEPNAGIRKANNQLLLFAAKRIRPRQEILIDYSTTIGDDDIWTMRCRCGARMCRRVIKRFGTLPVAVRRSYLRDGLVPRYIIRTLAESTLGSE
jgi:SET domain-containing protein